MSAHPSRRDALRAAVAGVAALFVSPFVVTPRREEPAPATEADIRGAPRKLRGYPLDELAADARAAGLPVEHMTFEDFGERKLWVTTKYDDDGEELAGTVMAARVLRMTLAMPCCNELIEAYVQIDPAIARLSGDEGVVIVGECGIYFDEFARMLRRPCPHGIAA